ncbi:hypothetical protein EJD96_17170 [Herbaspirillum seropedicae]|nr:hypothetical protein EJD96_17170 [Herbaspirillum seropedicae]
MKTYRNLGGDSNVVRYEIENDSITVEFASGVHRFYLYDQHQPGRVHVEQLKALAEAGQGLNSYIGKNLKTPTSYARRW